MSHAGKTADRLTGRTVGQLSINMTTVHADALVSRARAGKAAEGVRPQLTFLFIVSHECRAY